MSHRGSSRTASVARGLSPCTGPLNATPSRQDTASRHRSLSRDRPREPPRSFPDDAGANRETSTFNNLEILCETRAESWNRPRSNASSAPLSSPVPMSADRRGRSASRHRSTGSSGNWRNTSRVGQTAPPSLRTQRLSSVVRETIPSVLTQLNGQVRRRKASTYEPWRRRSSSAPHTAAGDYPRARDASASGRQRRPSSMAAGADASWLCRLRSSTTGRYSPPTGLPNGASRVRPQTAKTILRASLRPSPTPEEQHASQGDMYTPPPLNVHVVVVHKQRTSLQSAQVCERSTGNLTAVEDPPVDIFVTASPVEEPSPTRTGQASSSRRTQAVAPVTKPRSHEGSPPLDSLPLPTTDVNYGDEQPGQRFCMKFWFLGSVAVVPVILPLLLLWLSYYITPGAKRVTAGSSPALRNHSTSMNRPNLGPTILRTKGPTVRVTSLPTSNPTLGLMSLPTSSSTKGPTSIPTSSPTLGSTRSPTSIRTPSPTPPLLTTEPPFLAGCGGEVPVEEPQVSSPVGAVNFTKKAKLQNTFCIYNNTRVTEGRGTPFLPENDCPSRTAEYRVLVGESSKWNRRIPDANF
ncbi:hypothetical protein HPB48_014547 [Haemaphysalis longicornis]|uniref:Uncharacterized protein n=1 Tax=Haemaphysalis longicornis TaxID=44386 RepID=A0A9J6H114_HAELO|nr:hypothetical protein HPB48_014547 [Haemaphysalis longicornis]